MKSFIRRTSPCSSDASFDMNKSLSHGGQAACEPQLLFKDALQISSDHYSADRADVDGQEASNPESPAEHVVPSID